MFCDTVLKTAGDKHGDRQYHDERFCPVGYDLSSSSTRPDKSSSPNTEADSFNKSVVHFVVGGLQDVKSTLTVSSHILAEATSVTRKAERQSGYQNRRFNRLQPVAPRVMRPLALATTIRTVEVKIQRRK